MWTRIAKFILRQRLVLLLILFAVVGIMTYFAAQVKLSYEYVLVLPKDDTASIQYRNFRAMFGDETNAMLIGFTDSTMFKNPKKVNEWLALKDTIEKMEGIQHVLTAFNTINLVKNTELKKFEATQIFPNRIADQTQLDTLVEQFKNLPFYKGLLYNDNHFHLMVVTIEPSVVNSKRREHLTEEIENVTLHFASNNQTQLHLSGMPYARTRVAQMVRTELLKTIALATIVTAIILFLLFRSFKIVFFSLLVVASAVVMSLGTIVLFGYKLTILSAMIPPLMIVIGIPNCVYIINKYHNEFRRLGDNHKALENVISKIGSATLMTNLTTAVGFATFIITNNQPLFEFGWVASVNIIGIFVISLLMLPIIFSYTSGPKEKHIKHLDSNIMGRIIEYIEKAIFKGRKWVFGITIAVFLAAIFGVSLMHSLGYVIDDVPKDNRVMVDLKFFEKQVNGMIPFEISIDTKKEKGVTQLSTLNKIEQLEQALDSIPELSRGLSIIDVVKFARQAYFNGASAHYRIPNSQEAPFILNYASADKSRISLLQSMVDSTGRYARVSLRVADVGTVRLDQIERSVRTIVDTIFAPEKYNVSLTGLSVIFLHGTKYLITNLVSSVLLAVVLIALCMGWLFASWRIVLVSMLPNLLTLLITAAIMGYADIPIKPSTILVFSIALGIAVDSAIHFLTKYRQELKHSGWDIDKSIEVAVRETGVSIIYTAIILFFGFSIFILSDFGGTVALGTLISLTLGIGMLGNIILLPSLLISSKRYITTEAFNKNYLGALDEEETDTPPTVNQE